MSIKTVMLLGLLGLPCLGSPGVVQMALGTHHSCALFENGSVKCWGYNHTGQLGLGDTVPRGTKPGDMEKLPFVPLGDGRITGLSAGTNHNCVLFENGGVKCWGDNSKGQLGIGPVQRVGIEPGQMGEALPFVNLGTAQKVISLAVGGSHSCALLESGDVKCWGENWGGQLGVGDTKTRGSELTQMGDNLPVVMLRKKVHLLRTGNAHSCAILETNEVKCWGYNIRGQLGLGDINSRGGKPEEMGEALPALNFGSSMKATSLSLGTNHSCVLLENGRVKCWGANEFGALGTGLGSISSLGTKPDHMGDNLPYVALATSLDVIGITAGEQRTCALLSNRAAQCWGDNRYGQLAVGDTENRGDNLLEMGDDLPFANLGKLFEVQELFLGNSIGTYHLCAVEARGGVKCWGANSTGQLGLNDSRNRGSDPATIGDGLDWVKL